AAERLREVRLPPTHTCCRRLSAGRWDRITSFASTLPKQGAFRLPSAASAALHSLTRRVAVVKSSPPPVLFWMIRVRPQRSSPAGVRAHAFYPIPAICRRPTRAELRAAPADCCEGPLPHCGRGVVSELRHQCR